MSHVRTVRIHLGMPDASGRQTPQEIPNSHFNIEADLVLKALGFDPEDLPAAFDDARSRRHQLGHAQDRLAAA